MNRHRLPGLLMAALLCFGGCAASSADNSKSDYAYSDMMYESNTDGGYYEGTAMTVEESTSSDAGAAFVVPSNAKRVYRADVNIQTQTFNEALSTLRTLISSCSGFIQDEDVSGMQEGAKQYASIVARVPTGDFDGFIDGLNEVGNVTRINKWSENITKNYYDTKGMIDSLEKERDRLNELMNQADTVADLIVIEDKLFEVEQELQSYQNDLSQMDLDLDYSTITISLSEVQVYTTESYSPWKQVSSAFANTWVYFGDSVGELLLLLIYCLPWLLVLGLIGFLCFKGVRALIRRRRNKASKAKHLAPQPDMPPAPKPGPLTEAAEVSSDTEASSDQPASNDSASTTK